MKVTYIHHSCFLVETDRCYYLFDYEKGSLPEMDVAKPIFVLASHSHGDHYQESVFSLLSGAGMQKVRAILSDDIKAPETISCLSVSAGKEYVLDFGQTLTTFRSTDLGVAFLIEDGQELIYHAGDLNDWVWDEETDAYNAQMTIDYREQIDLLSEKLNRRSIDTAFVVLDPRQEKDYDRGLLYFLKTVSAKQVYPMHFWNDPAIIDTFLRDHPEYRSQIRKTQ